MKNPVLDQLAQQIEELRQELNHAVQTNRESLHTLKVQALSARLDAIIAEFLDHRKKPSSDHSLVPRQSCESAVERYPGPKRSERAGIQDEFRRSGVNAMNVLPWGTHLCQFYQGRQDLIDILVPYFRAGLEHNEFCLWVTCEPLDQDEAAEAMTRAMPGFHMYLEKGQIEILPCSGWYFGDGAFSPQGVLDAWAGKLNQALAKGYDGMRASGNAAWLEPKDWKGFMEYENLINNVIRRYRVMAICSYPIDKCGPRHTMDVLRNHQLALIKETGGWQLV
ncbi:MAG: MEDS domain-containing protein [Bacillota bacterium]